ncbi:MAG TPA: dienelactone hydrolase family protein, partial [Syntrophales bacterium]|nr:dienelactone hydrolase family protein [Syntrophales bacterium]
KTPALDKLCAAIGADVGVIDPYAGEDMGFQTEEQAYEFFMENIGLNGYCHIVQSTLEKTPSLTVLIGFSVGASAVWQISESLNAEKVKRAVCFYGSQVRHLTEIHPNIMIDLVLPTHEAGFSVDALAQSLSGRENVVLHRTPYLHGFMNELSKNYDKSGYTRYVGWLCHSVR